MRKFERNFLLAMSTLMLTGVGVAIVVRLALPSKWCEAHSWQLTFAIMFLAGAVTVIRWGGDWIK